MKKSIIIVLVMLSSISTISQEHSKKTILKNKMEVSWYYEDEKIFFEMKAPTKGWVTIGFNTNSSIKGAYLLMGNIIKGRAQVVEHYTLNPGNYKTISFLGGKPQVDDIIGDEKHDETKLKFSLPVKPYGKYQKDLSKGGKYTMIVAYSLEDDFQHHSIMRTSVNINL